MIFSEVIDESVPRKAAVPEDIAVGFEDADREQVLELELRDVHIVNYRFKFELLARQRPALVCNQIGNHRSLAGTLRGGRKSSLRGTAIRNVAPDLGDFTCESEGVTEIEREVGG